MKTLKQSMIAMAMMASAGSANAVIIDFFNNFSAWQTALPASYTTYNYVTNYTNVSNSTGASFAPLPANSGSGCTASSSSPSDCARIDTSKATYIYDASSIPRVKPSGNAPTDIYNNVDLGSNVSFNNSGIVPWNFTIRTFEQQTFTSNTYLGPGTHSSSIIFNDIPALDSSHTYEDAAAFTDALSIGKYNGYFGGDGHQTGDEWDNDNFTIEFSGPDLYAFGFYIVNNFNSSNTTPDTNEWLEVFMNKLASGISADGSNFYSQAFNDTGDNSLGQYNNIPGNATVQSNASFFVGIISDTPFSWLEFNESNNNNDIAIKDFYFASNISAVPLPAAFWLFASGLLGLIGLRKKRQV